jgi:competence ComEA-like helix-hairpin-helix protein
MIKGVIIALFIFLIGFVSAACNSTQIDINTASAGELDKIIGVGNSTAQKIIANRTYNSVDDLIRVSGIGNVTLAKIKTQGLACVSGEENEETEDNDEETIPENNSPNDNDESNSNASNKTSSNSKGSSTRIMNYSQQDEVTETGELAPIYLNSNSILSDSKDIKTADNKEILKENLPVYGLIAFCAVFGTAFLLKQRKKKHGFE